MVIASGLLILTSGEQCGCHSCWCLVVTPSILCINNTSAPHVDILCLMNPFSRESINYFFNSYNYNGAIIFGGIMIGWVPRITLILNFTFPFVHILGWSSQITSRNSFTTWIAWKLVDAHLKLSFSQDSVCNPSTSSSYL